MRHSGLFPAVVGFVDASPAHSTRHRRAAALAGIVLAWMRRAQGAVRREIQTKPASVSSVVSWRYRFRNERRTFFTNRMRRGSRIRSTRRVWW